MIKTYVEYNSQNEIYFHHSVSTFEEHKTFIRKPETHLQCEILFLLSGKVTYKIDGDSYEVHPGEMILLNMYELHTMYSDPSEPYERIVFAIFPKPDTQADWIRPVRTIFLLAYISTYFTA